jgi:uncharacterized tellurite resistance protein B-like protein
MALAQHSDSDSKSGPLQGGPDFASIKLTPPLVLTIALMFIIASDGHVDSAESSQIQSVIGQNEALVEFASEYVRTVPLPTFLSLAAQGLSREDRLCIVSNLYDAILSDGVVHDIEQKTFDLLLRSFGIHADDFAPHKETLALKNDKSVLGAYKANAATVSMTPHLALAAAVLYMMSADGSIDKHEIGRLETLVVEFGGLQRVAVAYVKKTKRERFFQEASLALTPSQKLCILLNVYDTMTADGVVAITEDKIFQALLDSFGVKPEAFTPHADVLERKNLKPFDVRKVNVGQMFESVMGSAEVSQVQAGESRTASMGDMVSRTIEQNMVNVQQDIGSSDNVIQIQSNALGQINLQQVDAANDAEHREKVSSDALAEHREKVGGDALAEHREQIDGTALGTHRETIDNDALQTHREALDTTANETNRQSVAAFEIRIDNLSDDIEALHDQLLKFEKENQQWLSMGKALQAEVGPNNALLPEDGTEPNRAKTPLEALGQNFQALAKVLGGSNRQTIPEEGQRGVDAQVGAAEVASASSSSVTSSSTHLAALPTDQMPQDAAGIPRDALLVSRAPLPTDTPSTNQASINRDALIDTRATIAADATTDGSAAINDSDTANQDKPGADNSRLVIDSQGEAAHNEAAHDEYPHSEAAPHPPTEPPISKARARMAIAFYQGRTTGVLPWGGGRPIRWGVKETLLALTLCTTVPDLGVLKAQPQREARGVLVVLDPSVAAAAATTAAVPALQTSSDIEFQGP